MQAFVDLIAVLLLVAAALAETKGYDSIVQLLQQRDSDSGAQ